MLSLAVRYNGADTARCFCIEDHKFMPILNIVFILAKAKPACMPLDDALYNGGRHSMHLGHDAVDDDDLI